MDKNCSAYCTDALRLLGHLWTPGSGPSPEALAEITEFLGQMLDSWNTLRNAIYSLSDLSYTLTSGQYIYTVGPGGNFNGPRPEKIQRIDLIYETEPQILRLPIELIDVDQWSAIRVPNLPNAVPYYCYYDNGYSQTNPTGLGQLYFWPGPQAGFGVEMWIWTALPSVLVPTTTLFLPPGYARAITYNLAVEIMALYSKRLTPEREGQIRGIAKDSYKAIARLNSPSPITSIDPRVGGGGRQRGNFNWLASTN